MAKNDLRFTAGMALYIPAIQPDYTKIPTMTANCRVMQCPVMLPLAALNFLSEDGALLHSSKALISAGLILKKNLTRAPIPTPEKRSRAKKSS